MISTNQVAKRLGVAVSTLSRYITAGKIPTPKTVMAGDLEVHSWTEEEIERVRELLPKIANGRKTRHKKQSAVGTQQSAKTKKKTQARVPAPHKKK
jgi:predicted DNA-binding transcriptional regulator AlpA